MITQQLKDRLGEIAAMEGGELWSKSRADYMLSVIGQLERREIPKSAAHDWMWDVIRRIDEDADDPVLAAEIKNLARDLGDLEF
jgi:hypothetical protein